MGSATNPETTASDTTDPGAKYGQAPDDRATETDFPGAAHFVLSDERPSRSLIRGAVGASQYHTLANLGYGGMAEVQLALQTNAAGIQRLAVVKRVRPELAACAEMRAMFLEEARIATLVNHPNIVHTYEVGLDERGCFLVMEALRGQTYHKVLDATGYAAADYAVSIEILLATLRGLECAHELCDLSGRPMGLVHRDVSPQNVFVTYDGQVKLLDFGIAKSSGSAIETQAGEVKGKVAYMAPEQVLGVPVDLRADLYGLGVMLWEATAGRRRWSGAHTSRILSALLSGDPPTRPGAPERGLPGLADAICQRCLAHDPDDRYPSAAALRADLAELATLTHGRGVRDLGRYVTRLFVVEREREQQIIEAALARFARHDRSAVSGAVPAEPNEAQGTRVVTRRPLSGFSTDSKVPTEPIPQSVNVQSKLNRNHSTLMKRGWLAFGVVAAVSLATMTLLVPQKVATPKGDAAGPVNDARTKHVTSDIEPALSSSATTPVAPPTTALRHPQSERSSASAGARSRRISVSRPVTPEAKSPPALDRGDPWLR